MQKTLAITYGDPQGVGLEILNSIMKDSTLPELLGESKLILFGSSKLIDIPKNLESKLEVREIEDLTDEPGEHSFQNLDRAIKACQAKECSGLITGPISKQRWANAGHKWSGQTELLGNKTNSSPEMLFTTNTRSPWRIMLLTRHLPLKDVPTALTLERFQKALGTLRKFLQEKCQIANPKIALAGLNPHAGENGEIGLEEKNFWRFWAKELDLYGPFSPDDIWIRSSKAYLKKENQEFDAYLAPYHDQVLPLIKTVTDFLAVNVSIGLPFVRTSPDHGTAFDLVGTGKADSKPFLEAIKACISLA